MSKLPDSQTLRDQVRAVLKVARIVAAVTRKITIDDAIVEQLTKIVESDDTWNLLYGWLLLWQGDPEAAIAEMSNKTLAMPGFDILVILEIVKIIMAVIDAWKNRENDQDTVPMV